VIPDDDAPEDRPDDAASPTEEIRQFREPRSKKRADRDQAREFAAREAEREKFWKVVLFSDVGRREMWGHLQDAHFDADLAGFTPNGSHDPMGAWLNRGAQAYGYRFFLTLLRYAPEQTLLMLQEHDTRIKKER
jgi:hypothetical protein